MSRVAEGHFRRKRAAPLILRGSTSPFRGHPRIPSLTTALHPSRSFRYRTDDLRITSLSPTALGKSTSRSYVGFAECWPRRSLVVDGPSGASRGQSWRALGARPRTLHRSAVSRSIWARRLALCVPSRALVRRRSGIRRGGREGGRLAVR